MYTCRQIPEETARGMMSPPYMWGALRTRMESQPYF